MERHLHFPRFEGLSFISELIFPMPDAVVVNGSCETLSLRTCFSSPIGIKYESEEESFSDSQLGLSFQFELPDLVT